MCGVLARTMCGAGTSCGVRVWAARAVGVDILQGRVRRWGREAADGLTGGERCPRCGIAQRSDIVQQCGQQLERAGRGAVERGCGVRTAPVSNHDCSKEKIHSRARCKGREGKDHKEASRPECGQ